MYVGIVIRTIYGISGNELPPHALATDKTAEVLDTDTIEEASSIMKDKVLPLRKAAAEQEPKPYSTRDSYGWEVIKLTG